MGRTYYKPNWCAPCFQHRFWCCSIPHGSIFDLDAKYNLPKKWKRTTIYKQWAALHSQHRFLGPTSSSFGNILGLDAKYCLPWTWKRDITYQIWVASCFQHRSFGCPTPFLLNHLGSGCEIQPTRKMESKSNIRKKSCNMFPTTFFGSEIGFFGIMLGWVRVPSQLFVEQRLVNGTNSY